MTLQNGYPARLMLPHEDARSQRAIAVHRGSILTVTLGIFLFLTVLPAFAALNLTRNGDLTADAFDELGFDATGLVGYWRMNGDAHDTSGQEHHGTIVGATLTTDRFGEANKALDFDGDSDYVNIATAVNTGTTHTFVFWANSRDSTSERKWLFDVWAGRIAIEWSSSGINAGKIGVGEIVFGNSPSVNVWHHVVFVLNGGTSKMKMYLDGAQYGAELAYDPQPIGGGGTIGAVCSHNGYYFNGRIDEVRIFSRTLSADEILAMYEHERGKFSVGKDGTDRAQEFVEDPALPVPMRSKKQNLTVKGSLIEN